MTKATHRYKYNPSTSVDTVLQWMNLTDALHLEEIPQDVDAEVNYQGYAEAAVD